MQTDEDGKWKVVKMGLQPVQRDSMEYELQVSLSLDMKHKFSISKDNTGIFQGRYDHITEEDGEKLFHFLEEGIDVQAEEKKKRLEKLDFINTLRDSNETLEYEDNEIEAKAKMTIAD